MNQVGNFITRTEPMMHQALAICRRLFGFLVAVGCGFAAIASKISRLQCPLCHVSAFLDKVYAFFMEGAAAQAVKPVTLGSRRPDYLEMTPTSPSNQMHPSPNNQKTNNTSADEISEENPSRKGEVLCLPNNKETEIEKETSEEKAKPQARAPKKMVSINDDVEVIEPGKMKKKKKKSAEKLLSMDSKDGEPKPLKSILKKAGSNVKENDNKTEDS